MGLSGKPEYPPLLAPGLHRFHFGELYHLCVKRFPLSKTRPKIMSGLSFLTRRLEQYSINGSLWVDGSFLTEKIDPGDVDVVLRTSSEFLDRATKQQLAVLNWVKDNKREALLCDSYLFVEYPAEHPLHEVGIDLRRYWAKWFGCSRGGTKKGIAVIHLPTSSGLFLLQRSRDYRHPLVSGRRRITRRGGHRR